MVDTANERGSEGTAKGGERERKKEREREREIIHILHKTVTSFRAGKLLVLLPSSGVKTETVSEKGPRPTSVLAAIVNS